tara:strand:- start:628 stop:1131 length:504 start_codon:yes stop_codon:yes gene_type:complete
MRIELKNIKHFESMSEETLCFNASLYVDGRKVGAVSNRGHGGCHEYGFDMKTQQELNRWCEENLPKWSMDDDQEYETDLELHISNLVAHFLDTKYIKKLLKNNVVVMDDTCEEGECFLYKFSQYKHLQRDELIRRVVERNSNDERLVNPIVLNTLSLDEAKHIFYKS